MAYVAPRMHLDAFHCPICGTYARMRWETLFRRGMSTHYWISNCARCERNVLWKGLQDAQGIMLDPNATTAPQAHADMPDSCRPYYDEARDIAGRSPRGAAALLRLAVQQLCRELGQPGKNINDDIRALVQAGLPVDAQQALDVLRVTGNNAVHPGEMDLDANPELVAASFELINFIVDQQISQRKRIQKLFAALPQGAKDAIAKRDGTASGQPAAPKAT